MALSDDDINSVKNIVRIEINSALKPINSRLDGHDDKFEAIDARFDALDTKLDKVKDEIIRAFRMTEEDIRKDAAHVDELAETNRRVTKIERHVGLEEH